MNAERSTESKLAAAEALADGWDDWTLRDISLHLTCPEANLLAEFLVAFRGEEAAAAFLAAHAEHDEEGDLHYAPEEVG